MCPKPINARQGIKTICILRRLPVDYLSVPNPSMPVRALRLILPLCPCRLNHRPKPINARQGIKTDVRRVNYIKTGERPKPINARQGIKTYRAVRR